VGGGGVGPYLSGLPLLVASIILQPDDHRPVDGFDVHFRLWDNMLEAVPKITVVGQCREKKIVKKGTVAWDGFLPFPVLLIRVVYPGYQIRLFSSVSDPYSFFTDPDPNPVDPDGGQYGSGYGSGSGSNPDPGL
jgi:hypothetical protein